MVDVPITVLPQAGGIMKKVVLAVAAGLVFSCVSWWVGVFYGLQCAELGECELD